MFTVSEPSGLVIVSIDLIHQADPLLTHLADLEGPSSCYAALKLGRISLVFFRLPMIQQASNINAPYI